MKLNELAPREFVIILNSGIVRPLFIFESTSILSEHDDCGTKTDRFALERILGRFCAFRLESSPGEINISLLGERPVSLQRRTKLIIGCSFFYYNFKQCQKRLAKCESFKK